MTVVASPLETRFWLGLMRSIVIAGWPIAAHLRCNWSSTPSRWPPDDSAQRGVRLDDTPPAAVYKPGRPGQPGTAARGAGWRAARHRSASSG